MSQDNTQDFQLGKAPDEEREYVPWWGLPRRWLVEDAQLLIDDLSRVWRAQQGKAPGKLEADLRLLRRWFHPKSAGHRLRNELDQVPVTQLRSKFAVEPFLVGLGDDRYLLTPEGRVLLATLSNLDRSDHELVLQPRSYPIVQGRLLELYREWAQERLRDVIALQRGEGEPLRSQGLAAILFLLLNRSTSPERAIIRPEDPSVFDEVDRAIRSVLAGFADELSKPPRRGRRADAYSLYGGFALTEARRRLGAALVINKGRIFIRDGQGDIALQRLLVELRRRSVDERARVIPAFHEMRRRYDSARPVLASYRMAFERAANTEALEERLAEVGKMTDATSSPTADLGGKS